jgi:hypothetical protein
MGNGQVAVVAPRRIQVYNKRIPEDQGQVSVWFDRSEAAW